MTILTDPKSQVTTRVIDLVEHFEREIYFDKAYVTWAAGKSTEFKYNALGQRIDTVGSASTATADRRYFSQGEQRKNGSSWENHFYCRDHLGSIREVVKSDGSLAARYDYTPYGQRLTQYETPGYTCDLGYTGHITLPSLESGQAELVLTHFRAYDPVLMRWLSADPLGEEGGLNLYGYVLNDPINLWDPNGKWPEWAPGSSSYSWGEYSSDVGQVFVGQAKGAANNFSLGLYKPCYENEMQGAGGWIGDKAATAAQLATGAGVGAAIGKRGLTQGLKGLSNQTKGSIGEALSTVKHTMNGARRTATQQRIPGQRSIADSVWRGRNGNTYYVESKFGTSGLTSAQRAARNALGDAYKVDRWGYPFFGKIGQAVGGGLGAGVGAATSSMGGCN